jgi:DNA-binding response OmpR family regulator
MLILMKIVLIYLVCDMDKVLLIVEELNTAQFFIAGLSEHGIEVIWAKSAKDGIAEMNHCEFVAVLFDLHLLQDKHNGTHEADNDEFFRGQLQHPQLAVAALAYSNSDQERLDALEFGADMYLKRPFIIKELLLNIDAIHRRAGRLDKPRQSVASPTSTISFNERHYTINAQQQTLVLTQTEFWLFKYLFERGGEVVTKEELQLKVLNKPLGRFDRNLDMHISNTRRKLTQLSLPREWINTVRGQGYRFNSAINESV